MRLFDYIRELGSTSFLEQDLLDPDFLILAELSYLELDQIALPEKGLYLAQLAQLFNNQKPNVSMTSDDLKLLQTLAQKKRYRTIKVLHYSNQVAADKEHQFSASYYQLPANKMVLAFRGTDDSLIGWKEDMQLFYRSQLPSQDLATSFLKDRIKELAPDQKIILVGHSKGGHLAAQAASQLDPDTQERIQGIYTFDSPGHREEIIQSPGYQDISPRIKRYSPRGSMVARILHTPEPTSIIACRALTSFAQHNPFIWQIENGQFRLVDSYNEDSKQIKKTVQEWTAQHDKLDIKTYIDTLFDLLFKADIHTTTAFLERSKSRQVKNILKNWSNLKDQEKKMIQEMSLLLIAIRVRYWGQGWKKNPYLTKIWSKEDKRS